MQAITWMEYVGMAAFAFSGAQVAIARRMDLFGVIVLAAVTAIGGGMMRDAIVYQVVPSCLFRPSYWAVILVTALFAFLWSGRRQPLWFIMLCDSIGLAAFVVGTGLHMLEVHYSFGPFLFGTLITGVGGGMIRDLLAHSMPVILREDIYAGAALLGAGLLWVLYVPLGKTAGCFIALSFIVLLRMASWHWHWHFPIAGQREPLP